MTVREQRSDTSQRILEVAAERFRADGYEGVTMVNIAERLGITAQALYWHYPSKTNLLHAFLKLTLERTVNAFEAVSAMPASPVEKLTGLVRAHVMLELEGPDGKGPTVALYSLAVLTKKLPPEPEEELRKLNRQALDIYRNVLRAGIADGCFRDVAVGPTTFAITAMCTQAGSWFGPGAMSAQEVADLYADLALRMVVES